MANVAFKRGLSTNLFDAATGKIKITPIEGTFYLTTDTNRLYIAQNTGSVVELKEINRYIKLIDDYSNLPDRNQCAKGDFYYAIAQNGLCVCIDPDATTASARWQQINEADTNTHTTISGNSEATVTSDSTNGSLTINFNLVQKIWEKESPENVTETNVPVSFTIPASDLVAASKVAVEIGSDTNGNISLKGAGSKASSVKIVAGDNVTIDATTTNNIKISAADSRYTLNGDKENTALTFGEVGGSSSSFGFKSSDNSISVSYGDNDSTSFDIKHKAYNEIEAGTPAKDAIAPGYGGSITVISNIENENGHITGWTTQSYQLPDSEDTKLAQEDSSLVLGEDGKINLVLKQSDGSGITLATDKISYNIDGTEYTLGTNKELPVYSKTAIDSKLRAVDAMVYKGTVSKDTDLPTSSVSIGDTYKVAVAGSYDGKQCRVGDILIAQVAIGSEEDSDGYIPSGKIVWDHIESGNEDTTYTLAAANVTEDQVTKSTISLTSSADNSKQIVTVVGDSYINVSADSNELTISHTTTDLLDTTDISHTGETSELTDTNPTYGDSFTVIDGLYLKNGHVSKFSTKKVTLPESEDTTYSPKVDAVTSEDGKKLISVGLHNENTDTDEIVGLEVTSSTLEITTTAATNNANGIINMDLVWGSFDN